MDDSAKQALGAALAVAVARREEVVRQRRELNSELEALNMSIEGIERLLDPSRPATRRMVAAASPHAAREAVEIARRAALERARQDVARREVEARDAVRREAEHRQLERPLSEVAGRQGQLLAERAVEVGDRISAARSGAEAGTGVETLVDAGREIATGVVDNRLTEAQAEPVATKVAMASRSVFGAKPDSSTARVADLVNQLNSPLTNSELFEEFEKRGWIEDSWKTPEAAVAAAARRAHQDGLIARAGRQWLPLTGDRREALVAQARAVRERRQEARALAEAVNTEEDDQQEGRLMG